MQEEQAEIIAREVLEALEAGRQIEPFSVRRPSFSTRDAYAVTAELRRLRGSERAASIGRKIGFTNRGIWAEYGVYEPIWGDVYDVTASEVPPDGVVRASHLSEPKIEPEIVLGLADDLHSGMDERDILGALAWVAHGFEIVQSVFPGWRFAIPRLHRRRRDAWCARRRAAPCHPRGRARGLVQNVARLFHRAPP